MEKPDIALFLPDLSMGGAERVFVTLSRLLAREGYRITMVVGRKSGPLLDEIDSRVAVVDLLALREGDALWLSGMRTVVALTRYLRRNAPDVLLSTLTGANLAAIVGWRLAGRPCRLVIREAAPLANVHSRSRTMLIRALYPQADAVVVLTDFMKRQLQQLGLSEQKLTVIGNPIDADRIRRLAEQPVSNMVEGPYFLAIGRLCEQKDFPTLIRAFSQTKWYSEIKLVIIGDGPQRPMLEELIGDMNLRGRVRLMGMVSNPYPWLNKARGFVLSSRCEGYPNVLREAMHFQLPMVVTEYDPSVNSIVGSQPRSRCCIVPVGDVDRMARALDELGAGSGRRPVGSNYHDGRPVVQSYMSVLSGHA